MPSFFGSRSRNLLLHQFAARRAVDQTHDHGIAAMCAYLLRILPLGNLIDCGLGLRSRPKTKCGYTSAE